jgi:hypothetical protein
MRKPLSFAALAFVAVLFVGTRPALASLRTSEAIAPLTGVRIEGTCGFTATVDQRDPRTLTTLTDRTGSIVAQSVRTRTTTLFAGGPGGELLLDEKNLVTDVTGGPAAGTILFAGRGAIWGTDPSLGQPFFLWVTGVVLMHGTFDPKTGAYVVSAMRIVGQSTPLCESLTTGLKPRH